MSQGVVMAGRITSQDITRVGRNDDRYRSVRVDPSTHALVAIDYEHFETHAGSHYFVKTYADLAINTVFQLTIQTPNTTKWAHMVWTLDPEAETLWNVYEGVTVTTPLTAVVTPRNNNRNSTNTSTLLMRSGNYGSLVLANAAVDSASGTLIEDGVVGSGKVAGQTDRDRELILKQNTIYLFRALASSAGYVDFSIDWYEHTDKN